MSEMLSEPLTDEQSQERRSAPTPLWRCALELAQDRTTVGGSEAALCNAVRRGADLRVGTGFRHNEHIDVHSHCDELIHEFVDFRVTYLLDNRWTAGICNLRMPVQPPDGFGPRASMSFFLYNQNGQQAVARPYLDGEMTAPACTIDFDLMPLYKELSQFDLHTNAPSRNFIYDFDFYRYLVCDRWHEVFAHDAEGTATSGSFDALAKAFSTGAELKVAIRGLCGPSSDVMDHEVFVHLGSCYYYTERKLLMGATHPVVLVRPGIPLIYESHSWNFGWLLPRTDGHVARWVCDPYTLKFHKSTTRHAIRWFVGG